MDYSGEYCKNCGLRQSFSKSNLCSSCGQDKTVLVKKQKISCIDMATLAIRFGMRTSLDSDLKMMEPIYEDFGIANDECKKETAISTLLLSDLALTTHLYKCHFQNHDNSKKIIRSYDITLNYYLEKVYGDDSYKNARDLLDEISIEFSDAFKEDEWLKNVSRIIQHRLACAIHEVPFEVSFPKEINPYMLDIHSTMTCFIHTSEFINHLHIILSKCEVS